MIIKKGFYTKTLYQIQNGIIQGSKYSLFGLIHKKNEDFSFLLSDVEYIYNIPLLTKFDFLYNIPLLTKVVSLIFPKRSAVEFVSKQDSLYIPNLIPAIAEKLVETAINRGAKQTEHQYTFIPSIRSMKKITKGYTMLCDQFGDVVRKVYNKIECAEDKVDIKSIIYFDDIKEKGFKGIAFGKIAGGGSSNTIEIFGLSEKDKKAIYNIIAENSPNMQQTDMKLYKSIFPLFSPSRWFKQREIIMLADWGILHKQYGVTIEGRKYSSRTSAVKFETIKSYLHSGFLFKKMVILGATSVSTQENFLYTVKQAIWEEFKQRNIANSCGKVFKASLFHRRKQGRIILNGDCVIFKYKKETNILKYENIYSANFSKPHWYSMYGDIIIKGRRIDARAGEGGDINMKITHMWFGKGKNLIKEIEERKAYC